MPSQPSYSSYKDSPLGQLFSGIISRLNKLDLPPALNEQKIYLTTFSEFLELFSDGAIPTKFELGKWLYNLLYPSRQKILAPFAFFSLDDLHKNHPQAAIDMARFLLKIQEEYRSVNELIAFFDLDGVRQSLGGDATSAIEGCASALIDLQLQAVQLLMQHHLTESRKTPSLLSQIKCLSHIEIYRRQLNAMSKKHTRSVELLDVHKDLFNREFDRLLSTMKVAGDGDEKPYPADEQPVSTARLFALQRAIKDLDECIQWIQDNAPSTLGYMLEKCEALKEDINTKIASEKEKMATACDPAPYREEAARLEETIDSESKSTETLSAEITAAEKMLGEIQTCEELIKNSKITTPIDFSIFEKHDIYANLLRENTDLNEWRGIQEKTTISWLMFYSDTEREIFYHKTCIALMDATESEIDRLKNDILAKERTLKAKQDRIVTLQKESEELEKLGNVFETLKARINPALDDISRLLGNSEYDSLHQFWTTRAQYLIATGVEIRRQLSSITTEAGTKTALKIVDSLDEQIQRLAKCVATEKIQKNRLELQNQRQTILLHLLQHGINSDEIIAWLANPTPRATIEEEEKSDAPEGLWSKTNAGIIAGCNAEVPVLNRETDQIQSRIIAFRADPAWQALYTAIDAMSAHGEDIMAEGKENKDEAREQTGQQFINFANTLKDKVHRYVISTDAEPDAFNAFKTTVEEALTNKKKEKQLADHYALWKPALANIAIALTGVGALVLLCKAAYGYATGSAVFFFQETKRQQKVTKTAEILEQIKTLPSSPQLLA